MRRPEERQPHGEAALRVRGWTRGERLDDLLSELLSTLAGMGLRLRFVGGRASAGWERPTLLMRARTCSCAWSSRAPRVGICSADQGHPEVPSAPRDL